MSWGGSFWGDIIFDAPIMTEPLESSEDSVMSALSALHFHNEEAAYVQDEAHIWPNGPLCPHFGSHDRLSKTRVSSTHIGAHKYMVL